MNGSIRGNMAGSANALGLLALLSLALLATLPEEARADIELLQAYANANMSGPGPTPTSFRGHYDCDGCPANWARPHPLIAVGDTGSEIWYQHSNPTLGAEPIYINNTACLNRLTDGVATTIVRQGDLGSCVGVIDTGVEETVYTFSFPEPVNVTSMLFRANCDLSFIRGSIGIIDAGQLYLNFSLLLFAPGIIYQQQVIACSATIGGVGNGIQTFNENVTASGVTAVQLRALMPTPSSNPPWALGVNITNWTLDLQVNGVPGPIGSGEDNAVFDWAYAFTCAFDRQTNSPITGARVAAFTANNQYIYPQAIDFPANPSDCYNGAEGTLPQTSDGLTLARFGLCQVCPINVTWTVTAPGYRTLSFYANYTDVFISAYDGLAFTPRMLRGSGVINTTNGLNITALQDSVFWNQTGCPIASTQPFGRCRAAYIALTDTFFGAGGLPLGPRLNIADSIRAVAAGIGADPGSGGDILFGLVLFGTILGIACLLYVKIIRDRPGATFVALIGLVDAAIVTVIGFFPFWLLIVIALLCIALAAFAINNLRGNGGNGNGNGNGGG